MKSRVREVISVLLLLTIVGCSSNPQTIDREALKTHKISTIKLMSPKTLTPKLNSAGETAGAAAAGAGLIGGVIAAGIYSNIIAKRRAAMKPITDSMGTYDVRQILVSKLAKLSGNSFERNIKVKLFQNARLIKPKDLFINANYYLSEDHKTLTVDGFSQLQIEFDGEEYHSKFMINEKIPTANKQNPTQYLAKNPQVLKAMINSALDKLIVKLSKEYN